MKSQYHQETWGEAFGQFSYWLLKKSCKLTCLIILVASISIFIYEEFNEEIKWEIWSAFQTQYEIDKEEFRSQHGIIDEDEGIINFWDEQAEPVSI